MLHNKGRVFTVWSLKGGVVEDASGGVWIGRGRSYVQMGVVLESDG